MAKIAVILLSILFPCAVVCQEDTYILFDVEVKGHKKKTPIWLSVEGSYDLEHLRIERYLLPIRHGIYFLDHIDFHEKIAFEDPILEGGQKKGSLDLRERNGVKIVLKEGYVNFLGTLKVHKNKYNRLEMTFAAEESLVRIACIINPNILNKRKYGLL
ncbi:hypothetical protein [Biformimicrobium ophioploci]|uniref:Uncharacterized protein n=1 Tax=Biformimicrobium ophioploci TaxID=3036711 RepID=A0ABQ6LZZ8_9GAMM|nr:hypothetical protein [Microbulbifer sp. NKW57]GMG87673.1 hypothetical protein MNKW57_19940 [Microbulbifer sp. NKW57]